MKGKKQEKAEANKEEEKADAFSPKGIRLAFMMANRVRIYLSWF
jgi:hypothetical protein